MIDQEHLCSIPGGGGRTASSVRAILTAVTEMSGVPSLRSGFSAGVREFNYFELPSEFSGKSSIDLSTQRACLSACSPTDTEEEQHRREDD